MTTTTLTREVAILTGPGGPVLLDPYAGQRRVVAQVAILTGPGGPVLQSGSP